MTTARSIALAIAPPPAPCTGTVRMLVVHRLECDPSTVPALTVVGLGLVSEASIDAALKVAVLNGEAMHNGARREGGAIGRVLTVAMPAAEGSTDLARTDEASIRNLARENASSRAGAMKAEVGFEVRKAIVVTQPVPQIVVQSHSDATNLAHRRHAPNLGIRIVADRPVLATMPDARKTTVLRNVASNSVPPIEAVRPSETPIAHRDQPGARSSEASGGGELMLPEPPHSGGQPSAGLALKDAALQAPVQVGQARVEQNEEDRPREESGRKSSIANVVAILPQVARAQEIADRTGTARLVRGDRDHLNSFAGDQTGPPRLKLATANLATVSNAIPKPVLNQRPT